jgi:hypothetical protein
MTASISDPGQASAVVPAVIRGPAMIGGVAAKDALFHLQIHDPLQTYPEEGLRTECIKRIATGLDMPPEQLLGLADANHWSGWIIDDQTWSVHLQPVATEFVNELSAAYVRPAAKQDGIENWQDLVVRFDAAEIVNHPDRSKDAKDLWDRGAIGYVSLREATAFSDQDAQTDEEHQEYLARILRDQLALPAGEDEPAATDSKGGTQQTSADATEEPPSVDTAVETEEAGQLQASGRIDALMGAAELASLRTRELAGARLLRLRRQECPECVKGLKVPKSMVASAIGREAAVAVDGGVSGLVSGGAEGFQQLCHEVWGMPVDVLTRLAPLIEKHAGEHLFDDHQPLPAGFRTYATRLLQVEDGRQSVHQAA